jgi:putative endonuclease
MRSYWVYILCSKRNGTIYIGVTNDLVRRIYEHKEHLVPGFTKKYDVTKLVHVEQFSEIQEAIYREKCLKKWKRQWKLNLIEGNNPDWSDLSDNYVHPLGPRLRGDDNVVTKK